MQTAAGGDNIFGDVEREAVQATTELILARRPEVIIELRADPLTPDEERKERGVWQQLASVPAVRNRRVHIIADLRTVIPGPRVAEGIEAIAARIKLDGFPELSFDGAVTLVTPLASPSQFSAAVRSFVVLVSIN